MKTTAIRIEGQIISPEIFDRFDANDIKGQAPKDFGFETGIKIKDEIARAWKMQKTSGISSREEWKIFVRT